MKTNVKDILHHYLGCEAEIITDHGTIRDKITISTINHSDVWSVIPILRPLSDMTAEEINIVDSLGRGESVMSYILYTKPNWYPQQFLYLLKKGFDLFELLNRKQAFNRNTLKIIK